MTETTAPTVLPAFDPLNMAEQKNHMANAHGVSMHPKIRKAHLIEEHVNAHLCMDFAATNPTSEQVQAFLVEHRISGRGYRIYTEADQFIPHTHEAVPLAPETATPDEVAAAAQQIIKGEKPIAKLNAAERKALTALVDNDFAALAAEMRAFAAEVRKSRKADALAEFEAKKKDADKFRKRMEKATEKFKAAIAAIKEEAEAEGFMVANLPYNYSGKHVTFEVAALAEALKAIEDEVNADLERALSAQRSAHLAAQRTILLTGVPEGVATQVLNSIPSAKEMMVQAASQHEQPMPPQVEEPKTEYYISM